MAYTVHYINTIYYDLELTSHAMKALSVQLFEKLGIGISPLEHAALDTINCNEGICQRDLAKLILKDRANTGRILDALEEKGFIERFVDTKNNRLVKKMKITESGLGKLREIYEKVEGYLQRIRSSVTDEEIENLQKSIKAFREKILEVANLQI